MHKKNGFSCPLHWQQISTWVIFSMNLIFFCIFTIPLLIKGDKIALSVIFGILSVCVFLVGVIATIVDPSDKMLKEELEKRRKIEKEGGTYTLEISKKFDFCVICASNINSTSKHCKICNRCVDNFDHHCNWLNNCIGDQNYQIFFTLLIVVLVDLSYNVAIFSYAFSIFITRTDLEETEMNTQTEKMNVSSTACAVISLIMAVIDAIIICNICYLIIIHSWLRCQGLTTYEYIVQKIAAEDEKSGKAASNPNDQSENIVLKINQRSNKKKGRNKVIPQDLLEKIKKIEQTQSNQNKFEMTEHKDKIVINEKDFNTKIFKPIVDDIYLGTGKMNTKPGRRNEFNTDNNIMVNLSQESFNSLPKSLPVCISNGNNYVSGGNFNTDLKPSKKYVEMIYPPHYPYPGRVSDEKGTPSQIIWNANISGSNLNPCPSIENLHTVYDGHN